MCRYGRNCRDKHDGQHSLKYSHSDEYGSKFSVISSQNKTICRYGRDCREKHDAQHCSKYSHPADRRSRDERISCKFGNQCYLTDPYHRSKYSHPNK